MHSHKYNNSYFLSGTGFLLTKCYRVKTFWRPCSHSQDSTSFAGTGLPVALAYSWPVILALFLTFLPMCLDFYDTALSVHKVRRACFLCLGLDWFSLSDDSTYGTLLLCSEQVVFMHCISDKTKIILITVITTTNILNIISVIHVVIVCLIIQRISRSRYVSITDWHLISCWWLAAAW